MAAPIRQYEEEDYNYSTGNKHRGKALIFTFKKFGKDTHFDDLPYTDTDYAYLVTPLKKAGFEVVRHKDLTRNNVIKVLRDCAADDYHKDADMFLCIFLTYGDGFQGLVYAKDQAITLDEIQKEFMGDKCRNLLCKPKYFIFQASQKQVVIESDDGEVDEEQPVSQTVPADADFLLYWCTMPGSTYFWEGKKNYGTMFSRAMSTELDRMVGESQRDSSSPEDFKMLFHRTTFLVNEQLEKHYLHQSKADGKILPVVEDSLTKFYYFRRKP